MAYYYEGLRIGCCVRASYLFRGIRFENYFCHLLACMLDAKKRDIIVRLCFYTTVDTRRRVVGGKPYCFVSSILDCCLS